MRLACLSGDSLTRERKNRTVDCLDLRDGVKLLHSQRASSRAY